MSGIGYREPCVRQRVSLVAGKPQPAYVQNAEADSGSLGCS